MVFCAFWMTFKLRVITMPCCKCVAVSLLFQVNITHLRMQVHRELNCIEYFTPVTLLLHPCPVFQMGTVPCSCLPSCHFWLSLCAHRVHSDSLYWLSCFHMCFFPSLEHMFNIWDGTGCLKLWSYQFVFLRRHRCPNMQSPRALNIFRAERAHHCIYVYTIIIF